MPSRSEFAVRFGIVSMVLLALAGGLAAVLLQIFPVEGFGARRFPPAFLASTALLAAGSLSLSRARRYVRRERQVPFRRHLLAALACGTLFVTMQTYALTWLLHRVSPSEAAVAAEPFVAVMAALHAMHFIVGLLFLVYVSVQAFADRYDHEYYWGVTVCTWFWHCLGVAWVAILGVIGIASLRGA